MSKTTPTKDILSQCLRDIAQYGLNLQDAKTKYEQTTRYHKVGIGLALIKAREVYKVPNTERNPDGVNQHKGRLCADAAHNLNDSESTSCETPISFEHFLSGIQWLARRTAYKFIAIATNLGLTAESTDADIERMRKQKQLHGLNAAEWEALSRTQTSEKQKPEQPEPIQTDFFTEALGGFYEHGRTIQRLRQDVDHKRFSTAAALLTKQLEDLTGQKWSPSDEDHDPDHWRELWPDADLNAFGI